MVKKIEMVENGQKLYFGPFSAITIFLTNWVRKKAKAPLYTYLGMINEIIVFRATYLHTFTLKNDIMIFGVFQWFMKYLKLCFEQESDLIWKNLKAIPSRWAKVRVKKCHQNFY